jgi:hypothetical protein
LAAANGHVDRRARELVSGGSSPSCGPRAPAPQLAGAPGTQCAGSAPGDEHPGHRSSPAGPRSSPAPRVRRADNSPPVRPRNPGILDQGAAGLRRMSTTEESPYRVCWRDRAPPRTLGLSPRHAQMSHSATPLALLRSLRISWEEPNIGEYLTRRRLFNWRCRVSASASLASRPSPSALPRRRGRSAKASRARLPLPRLHHAPIRTSPRHLTPRRAMPLSPVGMPLRPAAVDAPLHRRVPRGSYVPSPWQCLCLTGMERTARSSW